MKKIIQSLLAILTLSLGLSACTSVLNVSQSSPMLARGANWVILPITNHTETPLAGQRVESILQPLLHQQGIQVIAAPAKLRHDALISASEQSGQDEGLRWAKEQGYRYAIGGSVDEWRYKVGIDGEPAIGLSLLIWDLETGRMVWSAVGAKSGSSREAVAAVAQQTLSKMLKALPLGGESRVTTP